jgi:hypothetical protein
MHMQEGCSHAHIALGNAEGLSICTPDMTFRYGGGLLLSSIKASLILVMHEPTFFLLKSSAPDTMLVSTCTSHLRSAAVDSCNNRRTMPVMFVYRSLR